MFIAVILDNLDMDEVIKKEKQMKAREQSAELKNTIPRRLRIFENFREMPKMARLKYVEPGFKMPKVIYTGSSLTHTVLKNEIV